MVRPCKIGVQLPEVERPVPWPDYVAMARAAEDVGFDSLWIGDHLLYDLPDGSTRGPYEAWTCLAALAASTSRIMLGPLVASTSFHAPAMLAKQAATVDAISGGRLMVGLGAGWNEREYRAFGFPYDHRVSRFEEAFTIIRRLLRGETVSFAGEYYDVDACVLSPPPVSDGGPHLMLGSVSPRMLSIGLPHVDSWNVWWSDYGNTVAGFVEAKTRVDAAVEAAGRAPGAVAATAAVLVELPGGAGRLMGETYNAPVPAVTGSPSAIADRVAGLADAGASHLQLVLDPITQSSIELLGAVLDELDRA